MERIQIQLERIVVKRKVHAAALYRGGGVGPLQIEADR